MRLHAVTTLAASLTAACTVMSAHGLALDAQSQPTTVPSVGQREPQPEMAPNTRRFSEGWTGDPVCKASSLELAPGGAHLLLVQKGVPEASSNPLVEETSAQALAWPDAQGISQVWRVSADAVAARFVSASRLLIADEQLRQLVTFDLIDGQWSPGAQTGRYAPSMVESVLVHTSLAADIGGARARPPTGSAFSTAGLTPFSLAFDGPVARTLMPDGTLTVHATAGRDLMVVGDGQYSGFHAAMDPILNPAAQPDLAFASLTDGTPVVYGRGVLAVLKDGRFTLAQDTPFYAQPVRIAGTSAIRQLFGPDRIERLSEVDQGPLGQLPAAEINPAVITPWIRAGWHLAAATIDPQSGRSAMLYRAFGKDDAALELREPGSGRARIAVCDRDRQNTDQVQLRPAQVSGNEHVPAPKRAGQLSVIGPPDNPLALWLVRSAAPHSNRLVVFLRGGPGSTVLPLTSDGEHARWGEVGFDLLLVDYSGTAGMSAPVAGRLAADVTGSLRKDAALLSRWLREQRGYPERQLVASSFGAHLAAQLLNAGDTGLQHAYIVSGAAGWRLYVDPTRMGQAGGERRLRLYSHLVFGAPMGNDLEEVARFREKMLAASFLLCGHDGLTLLLGQHDTQIDISDWSVGCLSHIPRIVFQDMGHAWSASASDWLLRSLDNGAPQAVPSNLTASAGGGPAP